MKEKKIIEIIDSLKVYDELLRKYNMFYTKYHYLPGEYRKMSIEEKNDLYNKLSSNLETIENLLNELRAKIWLLKGPKENKKTIDKIIRYNNYYRDLFTYKLEYTILDYIEEDIKNPKKLDLKTEYELQLADIECLKQELSLLSEGIELDRANGVYNEMYRISVRNNNSAVTIKQIDEAIENNDFEYINKALDNKNSNLSKEDEIIYLKSVKCELNSRLTHNNGAIEYYKLKLSKILKKEIKF